MELVDKAITINDFGIRKNFPWTGSAQSAPWTQVVTDSKEISFVKELLFSIFYLREPIIKRVENPYLWARYVLAYEELGANVPGGVTERRVIHATSSRNASNIAGKMMSLYFWGNSQNVDIIIRSHIDRREFRLETCEQG